MFEDITFQEWNTKYLLNLIKSVMKRRLFALSARTTPKDCLQLQVTWHYFCLKKTLRKIILAIILPVRFQKLYSNILIIFEN